MLRCGKLRLVRNGVDQSEFSPNDWEIHEQGRSLFVGSPPAASGRPFFAILPVFMRTSDKIWGKQCETYSSPSLQQRPWRRLLLLTFWSLKKTN